MYPLASIWSHWPWKGRHKKGLFSNFAIHMLLVLGQGLKYWCQTVNITAGRPAWHCIFYFYNRNTLIWLVELCTDLLNDPSCETGCHWLDHASEPATNKLKISLSSDSGAQHWSPPTMQEMEFLYCRYSLYHHLIITVLWIHRALRTFCSTAPLTFILLLMPAIRTAYRFPHTPRWLDLHICMSGAEAENAESGGNRE